MSLAGSGEHIDIQVPVAGTPVLGVDGNQQSLKRRSSFYSRGKRFSSMKPGRIGYPHTTIEPKHYYQHISPALPEPVRMKQLMAWLFRKSLDLQRSEHTLALELAREAEEQTLKALLDGRLNISWYSQKSPKKRALANNIPNPKNIENQRKLAEVKDDIKRLKEETIKWVDVIKEINISNKKIAKNDVLAKPEELEEPWLSKLKELQDFQIPLISSDTIDAIQKLEHNVDLLLHTLGHVQRQQSNISESCNKASSVVRYASRDPLLSSLDPIYLLKGLVHQLPPYGPV